MSVLFISDLHLEPECEDVARAFLTFMQERASQAEALYILGDFFEAWIGDDYEDPFVARIKSALLGLTRQGVPVFLMHGNRDFLLGNRFAEQTGCKLLEDPTLIEIYGRKILLMHGDTLCTRDEDYQAFRQMVRNRQWQQDFLEKPLSERLAIAQGLRKTSREKTGEKMEDIMDVTPQEVENVMAAHDVRLLIHGHTHRPAVHHLTLNGEPAERVVLGDWHRAGWVLTLNQDGYQLTDFPLSCPDFQAQN